MQENSLLPKSSNITPFLSAGRSGENLRATSAAANSNRLLFPIIVPNPILSLVRFLDASRLSLVSAMSLFSSVRCNDDGERVAPPERRPICRETGNRDLG